LVCKKLNSSANNIFLYIEKVSVMYLIIDTLIKHKLKTVRIITFNYINVICTYILKPIKRTN
jgi:hypothetical protein